MDSADGAGGSRRAEELERAPFTWVDLVDVRPGDRVLLIDSGSRRAENALRASACDLTTATLGSWQREAGAGLYDLICVDGVGMPSPDALRGLTHALSPEGRFALVIDNQWSPLRALDRRHGSAAPSVGAGRIRIRRALRKNGLTVRERFVLLRSSQAPATAFDLLSASAVEAVATATLSHVGGMRGRALAALPRLPASAIDRLAPAWLLVTDRGAGDINPDRVIGKVANRDSDEVKLIRGDPPRVLERIYLHRTPEAAAEVEALLAAERAGFALAPRIVGTSDETRVAVTYLRGTPLVTASLSDAEAVHWIGRAAQALGELQRLTRDSDGTVLVHGDLWLGNLLVIDDEITGIVDWTSARRGDPTVDQRFLLESLRHQRVVSTALQQKIETALSEGLERGLT